MVILKNSVDFVNSETAIKIKNILLKMSIFLFTNFIIIYVLPTFYAMFEGIEGMEELLLVYKIKFFLKNHLPFLASVQPEWIFFIINNTLLLFLFRIKRYRWPIYLYCFLFFTFVYYCYPPMIDFIGSVPEK